MRSSRLYQGKSLGTASGMYLSTNILSDMLLVPKTGWTKRKSVSLRSVCKFFNFSECRISDLLKNYLCKSSALLSLNKSIRKIKKNHRHRTSVVGLNDSATDICKSKWRARTWMNLSEIASGDFKPSASTYNFDGGGRYKHILNEIKIKACHIRRSLCWANCCSTKSNKVSSHLIL